MKFLTQTRGGKVAITSWIRRLTITFGQAIAYLVGYMLHDYSAHSWRYLLMIASIPGVILLFGMYFVPHAPRWIIKKRGIEQARLILRRIRPWDHNVDEEVSDISHALKYQSVKAPSLLKKPILFVLLLGIALGVAQQCSGINAIMYYGPVIFEAAGFFPVKNAILATFCIGLVNFFFTIITLACVDKLGRRILLLSGTLIAALSLMTVTFLFNNFPDQKFSILLAFSLYVAGYCISVGSLFWVIISEIYPVQVRGLAMSIATVVQYLTNFIISLFFLGIYQELHQYTFSLFGLFCILAFILIYFFVPETTGVSLEKIEERLMDNYKIRDIGCNLSNKKTPSEIIAAQ